MVLKLLLVQGQRTRIQLIQLNNQLISYQNKFQIQLLSLQILQSRFHKCIYLLTIELQDLLLSKQALPFIPLLLVLLGKQRVLILNRLWN